MSHVKSRSPWRRLLFVAYGMTWPSCHHCSKYSNSMPLDFSRLIKFSVELGGRLDARVRPRPGFNPSSPLHYLPSSSLLIRLGREPMTEALIFQFTSTRTTLSPLSSRPFSLRVNIMRWR